MTERILKFPLFHLPYEEIQSGKIQNNIYFLNFPAPLSAECPHLQDKRAEISVFSVVFYPIFVHKYPLAKKCTYLEITCGNNKVLDLRNANNLLVRKNEIFDQDCASN